MIVSNLSGSPTLKKGVDSIIFIKKAIKVIEFLST